MLVNGTRMVDTLLALTPRQAGYGPGMRGAAARCFRVAVPGAGGARSGKSAGHFRLYAVESEARAPQGGQQRLACPASWARAATAGPDAEGRRDCRHRETVCPGERDEDATESPTSRTRTPSDRPALPGAGSGTAAHVADHLVPGDTVLHAPGRELIVIDLFGQLMERILH